jgi:hypothetical protein
MLAAPKAMNAQPRIFQMPITQADVNVAIASVKTGNQVVIPSLIARKEYGTRKAETTKIAAAAVIRQSTVTGAGRNR